MVGSRIAPAALALALTGFAPPAARAADQQQAVAAEVARWGAFLRAQGDTDDLWKDVRQSAEPALVRAEKAVAEKRPLLALLRLGPVHDTLAAAAYVAARPAAQRKEEAAFEAEWARMGAELKAQGSARPATLPRIHPALLRAMAEAALPQVRIYYDASLEYGRSTTPDSGLYYVGAARAARDFGQLARRLSVRPGKSAPRLRALGAELDALEGEMLSAYRPPLSIEKHREFIGASSALKEARELDAAGLRHGALLRYLQVALRFASLRTTAPPAAAVVAAALRAQEARLQAPGVDHSLGRVFVEAAQSDLEEHAQDGQFMTAAAVVSDVLPRYFAALGPPPARAQPIAPRVTVTLVRWPYT